MNLRRKADLAAIKAECQLPDTLCIGDSPDADLPPDGAGAACKGHSGGSQAAWIAPELIETCHAAQVKLASRTFTETCLRNL